MMDEQLLEIRQYTEEGYKTLVCYDTWRVAVLNYIDEVRPENIEKLERHNETDEVFVLLHGQATLFLGEGDREIKTVHPQPMEQNKVYNVKRAVWHAVILSRDASVLIVENADTSDGNSEKTSLTAGQRKLIVEKAWTEGQAQEEHS